MVLEDEGLLLITMEDMLRELGATEIHACTTTELALQTAREKPLDCAILDVRVRGDTTYQIADVLAERDIPFIFCSGVTVADLEERYRHRPFLSKPYDDEDLKQCLERATCIPAG
jgi:CheY-like chemotaxis protein